MDTTLLIICATLILIPLLSAQIPRILHYRCNRNAISKPLKLSESSTPTKPNRPMTDGASTPERLRRPWDPPFPTSNTPKGKKDSEWLVLPPTSPQHTLSPTVSEHADEHKHLDVHEDATSNKPAQQPHHTKTKEPKSGMSVTWTIVAILAGLMLALGVVVLMIHCLAWFIVYKTEARLGEARRGLLIGGEMRLCLCGR